LERLGGGEKPEKDTNGRGPGPSRRRTEVVQNTTFPKRKSEKLKKSKGLKSPRGGGGHVRKKKRRGGRTGSKKKRG